MKHGAFATLGTAFSLSGCGLVPRGNAWGEVKDLRQALVEARWPLWQRWIG